MNVIQILLHIGSVIKTVDDGEKVFNDIVGKKSVEGDLIQTLTDAAALVAAGLIPLPEGITIAMVQAALNELKAVLQPQVAAS